MVNIFVILIYNKINSGCYPHPSLLNGASARRSRELLNTPGTWRPQSQLRLTQIQPSGIVAQLDIRENNLL